MENNLNIIGYLQKKHFFQQRPPVSPSPHSRFSTHTPEKSPLKPMQPRASHQTLTLLKNHHSKIDLQKNQQERRVSQKEDSNFASTRRNIQVDSGTKRFDSSRIEIKMCLEDYSRRVSAQLRQLDNTLAQLTASLQKQFSQRLTSLKQQLLDSIQTIFLQARKDFHEGLNQHEQMQLKRLTQTKAGLNDAESTLKRLKADMQSSWKKVASEVLGGELDDRFETILRDSEQVRKQIELIGKNDRPTIDNSGWAKLKEGIDQIIRNKLLDKEKSPLILK